MTLTWHVIYKTKNTYSKLVAINHRFTCHNFQSIPYLNAKQTRPIKQFLPVLVYFFSEPCAKFNASS